MLEVSIATKFGGMAYGPTWPADSFQFSTILAKGRDGSDSKTRKTYMRKLAGEIITGKPTEGYTNAAMERGHEMEGEARAAYEFEREIECELVGFIRNGQKGCNPDSLVQAMTDFWKSKRNCLTCSWGGRTRIVPRLNTLRSVGGRFGFPNANGCDLVIYWPECQKFIMRTHRDDKYIMSLSEAVDKFNDELAELVEKVRAYV